MPLGTVTVDPRSAEVWDFNLKKLRLVQPALAARLDDWLIRQGRLFSHQELRAENGVRVEGLTPTPFFQPDAYPALPWKNASEAQGTVLFIYGAGAAPWLYTVLRSLPCGVLSVVVLEPSLALLAYALHTTAVYKLLPEGCRIAFLSAESEPETQEALTYGLTELGAYSASRLAVYVHPGEAAQEKERFVALQAHLRAHLVLRLHQLGNSMGDTLLGLRHMALTAPWVALGPRLAALKAAYAGRPFIWVASGPSLDKNVHLLRENRNRAVIVCADTAAFKLLEGGIVPHVLVAFERGRVVWGHIEKICLTFPEEAQQILLVAQAVCVPEVVGKWPGAAVVVGKAELSLDRWMLALLGGDLIVSGLSVAHMGLWLAAYLGAGSLALVGQDLAFGPEGMSHAQNTVSAAGMRAERSGQHRVLKDVLRVPGSLGGTVETHEIWRVFLRMIEHYIPVLGCPVCDCTEGGARIRGAEVLPLREWMRSLDGLESFDASPARRVLDTAAPPQQRGAEAAARLRMGLGSVARALEALEGIQKAVERTTAPALSPERRRRLAETVYRLLDAFHRDYPVMDFIGQGFSAVNALGIVEGRGLEDVARTEVWGSALYAWLRSYRSALRFMGHWLDYAAAAVLWTATREGALEPMEQWPVGKVGDLNGMERCFGIDGLTEALARLDAKEDDVEACVFLDHLLARADHRWWRFWDVWADWKVGLALERNGRLTEAAFFMERFRGTELDISGLEGRERIRFYLDYARIAARPDLVGHPDLEKAERLLQEACAVHDATGATLELKQAADGIAAVRKKIGATDAAARMEGKLYSSGAPDYVVEELSRMVEEVLRLAGAAKCFKDLFFDFSPPLRYPKHT